MIVWPTHHAERIPILQHTEVNIGRLMACPTGSEAEWVRADRGRRPARIR